MSWKDKWRDIKKLDTNSGQGDCYIVEQHSDNSKRYFLKEMKQSDLQNSKRRRHFFKETVVLERVKDEIQGIAKIIDTNAKHYIDKNISLYYVSEYIEGKTLTDYVQQNSPNELLILDLMKQLLKILKQCHLFEIIHRDIKPDNIIIDANNKLFLVDFGISFIEIDNIQTDTESELGNRFLRLPEFCVDSSNRNKVESDLTLACGILYYMLFKKSPRELTGDAEYGQPHKSPAIKTQLDSLKFKHYWKRILDKGFNIYLADRWSKADHLIEVLEKMNSIDSNEKTYRDILSAYAENFNLDRLNEIERQLNNKRNLLQKIAIQIINLDKGFKPECEIWNCRTGGITTTVQVRAYPLDGSNPNHVPFNFTVKFTGEAFIGYLEYNNSHHSIFNCSLYQNVEELVIKETIEELMLMKLVEFTKS